MNLYQKLKKQNINLSAIGLKQSDDNITYFCTPKGAKIIGWADVDGIHYCTIRGLGEMIFAVSPSNMSGDYVHPIARNFEELLGLLMSCGSMDAIEQAHFWEEGQFEAYLKENLPTEEHLSVMNVIKDKYAIEPMSAPFSYIKNLQTEFAYSLIKYPAEYYDMDMNPAAEPEAVEWKVTYDDGFWNSRGRACKEMAVGKTFFWGGQQWYVPSVYICSKGLVMDICMEADPEELKAYIEKWDLLNEGSKHYSKEQREQMENEHPLVVDFEAEVTVNGKKLQREHGYGVSWIPTSCVKDEIQIGTEAKRVLDYYGLDQNRGWSIQRIAFKWATKCKPVIKSLELKMERSPKQVPGIHFRISSTEDKVVFSHPVTKVQHTLRVHEYEKQQLEQRYFPDDSMEYPEYLTAMTYTVDPEIPGQDYKLRDYKDGDRPRRKQINPNEFEPVVCAGVTVIGRADRQKMVLLENGETVRPRTVCSSLYFDQPKEIEWYITFFVKTVDDIQVKLI